MYENHVDLILQVTFLVILYHKSYGINGLTLYWPICTKFNKVIYYGQR
jgi:hypothetical protein